MHALSIRGLRKVYDNGFEALKGIDLDVEQGAFCALLGPNGAGKSTTIGIVSSLVNKSAGEVSVFGHDLDRARDHAKLCIGLVPQEFNFNAWEPVQDILIHQAGFYGIRRADAKQRAEQCLKQLDLWEKRKVQARSLSGGMKRRLMIARALMHRPKLLILDEPTAGVDIEIRRSMWQFLQEINAEGTSIILTTHYLEEAEALCRTVAIINHGQIVERGQVHELLSRAMVETFVLDLCAPIHSVPALPDYALTLVSDSRLEVEVPKGKSLSPLFAELSAHGIEVSSMRNKSNRLEEFFLRLVQAHSEEVRT